MTEKLTRRRGAELETAILDAAWDVLSAHGWAGFTVERVAAASGTGKAAIYRRWPDKTELARDLLQLRSSARAPSIEPQGSLRGDLLEFLRLGATFLDGPFGEAARGALLERRPGGRLPHGPKLAEAPVPDVAAAVERAVAAGELAVAPSFAAQNLGQVLLTQEHLYAGTVDRATQVAIVDDLWLPCLGASPAPPTE